MPTAPIRVILARVAGVAALTILAVACSGAPSPTTGTDSTVSSATAVAQSATPEPTAAGPSPIAAPSLEPGPALEVLWEAGGPAPSMPCTTMPTFDPQGRIWVTSCHDDEFWVLDRDGEFIEAWGTPGAGEGEFDFARDANDSFGAIASAPNGGFYVADTGNQRVQRFDPDRNFVSSWGGFGTEDGQFVSPTLIVVAADESVYVLDDGRQVIQRFKPDGTFVEAIGEGKLWPASLATNAEGSIYYLEGFPAVLTKRDTAGEVSLRVDLEALGETFWSGLSVDADGHIYLASEIEETSGFRPDLMVEFDSDGTPLNLWPTGGMGIAVEPSGDRIYVAYFNWDHVTAYALPGD
jgi:DNA-binding beta-propeller fold protein YncE